MAEVVLAAAVNRDEVRQGADELGVDFDEHLSTVIGAMEDSASGMAQGRLFFLGKIAGKTQEADSLGGEEMP